VVDELPLGLVVVELELPDGDVVDELPLLVEPLVEPEPLVLLPGDAEGVLPGVPPTRSVSLRLHAAVVPASKARAQSPDSNLFISAAPPCGVSNTEGGCNGYARGPACLDRLLYSARSPRRRRVPR
jgi:hypothetical protein